MGFLSSCWFIIEFFVIPDGLWKWSYLRFYIHPLTLIPCQIFVWLKILIKWSSAVVIFIFSTESYLFRLIICAVLYVLSAIRVSNNSIHNREEFDQCIEITESCNRVHNQASSCCTDLGPETVTCEQQTPFSMETVDIHEYFDVEEKEEEEDFKDWEEEMEESESNVDNSNADTPANPYRFFDLSSCSSVTSNHIQENWMGEYVSSLDNPNFGVPPEEANEDCLPYSLSSPSLSIPQVEWNEHLSSVCDSNSSFLLGHGLEMDEVELSPSSAWSSSNLPLQSRKVADEGLKPVYPDQFHQDYVARMGWFDLLNCERTYWLSAILERQMGTAASSLKNMELANFSIPDVSGSTKAANRRLLRSIRSDFEVVYVAQTCLSWEALVYHYRKVEHLIVSSSGCQSGVSYHNVAREFQKFHVLLQRFMEDERLEAGIKRYLTYVQARFSVKSLLQVPQLAECLEVEREVGEKEVAPLNLREVAKAIEKCTKAYYKFVKTDNDAKSWWKFRSSLWTYPKVEDPRDLQLLADLTNIHQKKVQHMKDLQGKKKYWFNGAAKSPAIEESQIEILFTAIDLKLVFRVLQMTTVSTSQLKWCQQKLDNITFADGKIIRVETYPLFPP